MKIKVKTTAKLTPKDFTPSMAIMVFCLVAGITVGCAFATNAHNDLPLTLLGGDIKNLAELSEGDYTFSKTFFNLLKYPAITFVVAFSAFGVILIPSVMFFKGFALSLSVSSILATFGKKGRLTAISMFGIQALVSIPCLLILCVISFDVSKNFAFVIKSPKRQIPVKRTNFIYFILYFVFNIALLLLTALIDSLLTPWFLSLSLKAIFS